MSLLSLIVSHFKSSISCNKVDATESPVTQRETAVYKDEKEDLVEESGCDDVTGGQRRRRQGGNNKSS